MAARRRLRRLAASRHRPRRRAPRSSSSTLDGRPRAGGLGLCPRAAQPAGCCAPRRGPGRAAAAVHRVASLGEAAAAGRPTRARSTRRAAPATSTSSRSASIVAIGEPRPCLPTGCWSSPPPRPGPLPRPDRPPAIQGTARAARHPGLLSGLGAAGRELLWRAAEMQLRLPYSGQRIPCRKHLRRPRRSDLSLISGIMPMSVSFSSWAALLKCFCLCPPLRANIAEDVINEPTHAQFEGVPR